MPKPRPPRIRRVYDEPSPEDGRRVLVDRLWPRGLAKDALAIDDWAKAIAPSTELRKWYGHEPSRFAEFAERYRAELQDAERQDALQELRAAAAAGPLTLLTATKAVPISGAQVLLEVLTA